jgi:hypothetical protein
MHAPHSLERLLSIAIIVGVVASTMAAATIALVLTDPVALTNAVDTGHVAPLAAQMVGLIGDALATLLDYL